MVNVKIDIQTLGAKDQYRVISSLVVPRPIALISSRSPDGVANAAPFSLFNIFGEDPPVVIVGLQDHWDRRVKDTTTNILETREFVVNLVDESIATAMNVCAVDFPQEISETEMAGLTLLDCERVKPQRIAESPASLECRNIAVVQVSPQRKVVIGEVLMVHVRDGLMDPQTHHIDIEAYKPVGRLFGSLYTRTRDQFSMPMQSYADWMAQSGSAEPLPGSST
jgi:flavin reductase (DIM6/NTAB) family NADH-FMN oxidoreductase RutF